MVIVNSIVKNYTKIIAIDTAKKQLSGMCWQNRWRRQG